MSRQKKTRILYFQSTVMIWRLVEEEGGIAPGTAWEDVPEDFEYPLCGVGKDMFSEA